MSKELFTKEQTKEMLENLADLMRQANTNSQTEIFPIDYFFLLNQFHKKLELNALTFFYF